MAVTLRDIARQLNLSHATVSFVLNERYDVAIPESTRQRVMQTAREMGYRPNRAARALVMGRTQMLAFWMPTVRCAYYASVFDRLQGLCHEAGYEVIFCEARFNGTDKQPYDWPVDGVIAVDTGDLIAQAGLPLNMPLVTIGAYVDRRSDHVQVDLYQGAITALEHLVETGCKRIAHVSMSGPTEDQRDRYAAYRNVTARHNIKEELMLVSNGRKSTIRQAVREYITKFGVPEGIFCYNDETAIAASRALADEGVDLFTQAAVVGFDGLEITEYLSPSLTTVAQPVDEMCRTAVELLLRRIDEPAAPLQSKTLLPELIKRESTRR